jgi:hypothetical protein
VQAKEVQRGTRPRAGVGLGSNADRLEVGDDGRGPPVSLRGTAALSRPSRPLLTGLLRAWLGRAKERRGGGGR